VRYFLVISIVLFGITAGLVAQRSMPDEIKAKRISEPIIFDGLLTEPAWKEAQHISNFTQRDLNYGEPATERTEVAILYDDNTMYFGVWCYQEYPEQIVAKSMKPDFGYWSEDNFQIMISPFDDNRTGYLFVVNPNGARTDIQIFSGEDGNRDWNGVWDVKTVRTNKGWFAEIYIPFATLQFKTDKVLEWAINFQRSIASKHEQSLWQGWSRDFSIFSVPNAGKLSGIKNISYAEKFELKPYGLAGWEYTRNQGNSFPYKFGGDLNISLSPTLKLNLTSFTDFAQVEADRIPVNLSRFSVYYPEKRQFFLEGADLYDFYLGDRNSAFYTREIGIENAEQVPIIAGARVFGRIGHNNIGFLNIQEGGTDNVATTNNTVLRYKRNVGSQSWIGGIFTNKINRDVSNQVFGLDAVYQTSEFLKNKNLIIAGKISTSTNNFKLNENALTSRISVDYPNDLMDIFMAVGMMTDGYNPGLGFVRRKNYNSYTWHFRLTPRVLSDWGIKLLMLKPWGFTFYQTHTSGELESFYNETVPLGAVFKSGERFKFVLVQSYDRLDEAFDLTSQVSIPSGKYFMYKYRLQFSTYRARPIWTNFSYSFGDYYTGRLCEFSAGAGWNLNKYFNLNGNYTYNSLDLPQGNIYTNELNLYLNYSFNPKLNLSLFTQYNSFNEIMIYNFRLHWIPKVGSDFYFVYNLGYDKTIEKINFLEPSSTNAVVKLLFRIVF